MPNYIEMKSVEAQMPDLRQETITIADGRELDVLIARIGGDVFISISGGQEHIGSLSMGNAKLSRNWTAPPHKEYEITEPVRKHFRAAFPTATVVVLAGIHFDNISHLEIAELCRQCESWAEGYVRKIQAK
jgi:hypothetical protein